MPSISKGEKLPEQYDYDDLNPRASCLQLIIIIRIVNNFMRLFTYNEQEYFAVLLTASSLFQFHNFNVRPPKNRARLARIGRTTIHLLSI